MIAAVRSAMRRDPWIAPGVALTACAALGAHLTELVALAHRVLW